MNTRRILCVHEGPGLQKLQQALESDGYEVVSAATGDTALTVLSTQTVDGVVLDFDALAPGGLSLRGRIHHQRPDMPMLLISDVEDLLHPLTVFRACLKSPDALGAVLTHFVN